MTKEGTRHRSTKSGQFVTKSAATIRPATTVSEKIGGGGTGGTHRSAKSGQFVTDRFAKRHPSTTMKDS